MFKSLFAISDEQAMWRVQTEDDHAAFALLVESWREKIRQLCIRMTGKVTATSTLAPGERHQHQFNGFRRKHPATGFSEQSPDGKFTNA